MGLVKPPVIGRLEELAAITVTATTIDQLRTFTDSVRMVVPLPDIAKACSMSEEDVLKLTAKLGTWLRHSNKNSPVDLEVIPAAKMSQLAMFQDPAKMTAVMPVGFERHRTNRSDVANSFAAIVFYDPDEATLLRFLDRQYSGGGGTLEAHDVFMLWKHACLGFEEELDQLASSTKGRTSPEYAKVLVAAYELLATAVDDAVRAIDVARDTNASADDVLAAAAALRWVDEASLARLVKTATIAQSGRREILTKEQRSFATTVAVSRLWQLDPIRLEQLQPGQVLRIVEAAGLVSEHSRRDDAEVRRRLTTLGLERDMDRLLPMANQAVRAGFENLFWSAMERRSAADADWGDELFAALAANA